MSLEVFVFLNRADIPSASEWQAAARSANFKIEFNSTFDPLKDSGFVPCLVGNPATGFEYDLSPKEEIVSVYPDLNVATKQFDSVVSFTWGGDLDECAAATIAAAVLTNLSKGFMYDPQEDVRYSGSEALDYARQTLADIAGAM